MAWGWGLEKVLGSELGKALGSALAWASVMVLGTALVQLGRVWDLA
jgi:hypothetical protein